MKKIFLGAMIMIALFGAGTFDANAAQTPAPVSGREYTALEPLPCIPGGGVTCATNELKTTFNFKDYVQYIFNLLIAIAGAAAVFMIVFGGLQYMTTDSWSGKSEGITRVKLALAGLLLVLTSYTILRTIDPRLVSIPSTLVAPLNIKTTAFNPSDVGGYLDEFLSQIKAETEKYNADMAPIRQAVDESRPKLTAEGQKITTAESQIRAVLNKPDMTTQEIDARCSANPVEEQIRALCAQRTQAQGAVVDTRNVLNFNTAIGLMRGTVQQCGQTGTTCFSNIGEKAKFSNIFNEYQSKVRPDLVQGLSAYKLYAFAWFELNKMITVEGFKPQSPKTKSAIAAAQELEKGMITAVNYFESFAASHSDIVNPSIAADMRTRQKELSDQLDLAYRY